mgnify:CR=1 FL=1
MNEFLNPYTLITITLFLSVLVIVGFFIKKKSGSIKKVINNKKINIVEYMTVRGGFSAIIFSINNEEFFFVGHKSGNSNLIQINKSNNNTELNTPKSTQSMTKTDKTQKNISNESIKKPLEQVNISDLLALHKKK